MTLTNLAHFFLYIYFHFRSFVFYFYMMLFIHFASASFSFKDKYLEQELTLLSGGADGEAELLTNGFR